MYTTIIHRRINIISDVLGKITAVSNPAVVRNTAGDLMMRRIIKLQDLRYIFII
jgi:replication factor A1